MSMIQCMAAAQVVSEIQKLQTLQESVMKVALSQFNFFITVMQPINLNKKGKHDQET